MNLLTFFLQNEAPAKLIEPDSVQKAKMTEAFNKLVNIDISELLGDFANEMIWISVKIFVALVIYFIGRWILHRIVHVFSMIMKHRQIDESLQKFTLNTVRVLFTLILLLIVVQTLGVNVTSLIAMFSAATLAIGMALSGTAQNFAGGVMILLMKPYRIGDYISAQGQAGVVKDIKLFSTVICTPDNQTIYIPNNSIATAIIDNYSTAEHRRVDWSIGISYGDKVEDARKRILELLAADKRVFTDPAPVVWVSALADSSVNLTVRVWTSNADYWNVFFEYNEIFYNELPKVGVSFPFPQMDVHVSKID